MKEESKDFEAYSVGLVSASACSSLSRKETERRMNLEHPTGISSGWRISKDKKWATGEPTPSPCNLKPKTHKHYLFNC